MGVDLVGLQGAELRDLGDSRAGRGNRFLRAERLHLRRESQRLFSEGAKAFKFPYRALYHLEYGAAAPGIAVMVQAPKRLFKRATARNAQKRRIREAFRMQAHALRERASGCGCRVTLAIMLVSNEAISAQRGHRAVGFILHEVLKALESGSGLREENSPTPSVH